MSVKKRRRWGQTADDVLKAKIGGADGGNGAADAAQTDEHKRRRKRWGDDKTKIDVPDNSVIAAAASNLTPEETKALIRTLDSLFRFPPHFWIEI